MYFLLFLIHFIVARNTIRVVDKDDLNNIKYTYHIDDMYRRDDSMEVDDQATKSEMQFKDYTYSIISMEMIKFRSDSYYLLWGTDHGYLYTFNFQHQDQTNMISNEKNAILGSDPIYLYPMWSDDSIEGTVSKITIIF